MTIGLVTPYFPGDIISDSGIANHYLFLARSLASKGEKVIVLHIRAANKNENNSREENVIDQNILVITYKVHAPGLINRFFKNKWAVKDFALKLKCMFVIAKNLNKIITEHKIDVIETSSYFSLCYFCDFKKLKTPVALRVSTTFSQIMREHYPFKSRGMDIIARMEIRFIRRSKNLITHAMSHAIELQSLYGINHGKFQIIPHGIKLPDLAEEVADGNKPVKILYVGRMEYRKGTDVLLGAIPIVIKTYPNVLFELIGNDNGNEYQNIFLKSSTVATAQRTIFSARVDDKTLTSAYKNCDIFVAPSRYESFGLIYIEAMSFGKPVIGCKVGGVAEIIRENKNGLFAETGDPASLADRIIKLAESPLLRKEMGANARLTVENHFTGEHLATSSVLYYRKILTEFKN